jgi:predicted enzyme related to lactoylglutathione lyase
LKPRYRRILPHLILAITILAVTAACTTTRWPAIDDKATGMHTPGRWVWMELVTRDPERARSFYGQVFGWTFEDFEQEARTYVLIRAGDRPVGGILQQGTESDAARSAQWIGMMSVSGVEQAATRAADAGATTIIPPGKLRGRGTVAVLNDPEGALFGIIHSEAGDPPDAFPPVDTWLWMELWARDAAHMSGFYRDVGGYKVEQPSSDARRDDRPEFHLVAQGYARAGIVELKREDLPSAWLPYVRVADLAQTIERVEAAGGTVLIRPDPDIRKGRIAVIADPLGAAFGIAEWHEEQRSER